MQLFQVTDVNGIKYLIANAPKNTAVYQSLIDADIPRYDVLSKANILLATGFSTVLAEERTSSKFLTQFNGVHV